ncbi:MAG: tail fiber protein [Prolixibacteraceae bacterium]
MEGILGEIRAFAGNFAPVNWRICDGSLLPINEYNALFALIGVTYGGNGMNNFALPDLRGRLPIGQGQGPNLTQKTIGTFGGSEAVTLTEAQMPAHSHHVKVSTVTAGSVNSPSAETYMGSVTASSGTAKVYVPGATTGTTSVKLDASTIQPEGGSQSHWNVMPCVAINYIICVQGGVFPPQP